MGEIYVTGHRNPDTDSIAASIAYANLRNAIGDREYKAVRIGSINDETRHILDLLGLDPPPFVKDMRTQVSDLDFDTPPELNASVPINLAWNTMRNNEVASLPILNDDGTLYGVISAGDIASFDMQTVYSSQVDELPLFNLLSVIEGRVVNELYNTVNSVSGNVVVALPSAFESGRCKDGILICGNQPDAVERAIGHGAGCVILCQAEVKPEWASLETPCIISSPLDGRIVSRVIYQAQPIKTICHTENIVCFHLSDYLDDVREVLLESRFRAYPVLDENEHVVGTLSRFHLLRPRRKRVVLVDHNEAAQSVVGLDQVEIMEIIDHHRLADIQTTMPVSVRNEPVGSTNTILTSMYQEYGVIPSPKIAGLMAAAILSDTVMFKSPTCTKKDIAMAERLSKIAGISIEQLGKELFSSSGTAEKSAEELMRMDYKLFHISGQSLGVGQITCADSSALLSRKEEFLTVMEKLRDMQELDIVILMLTDVLLEGSYLIYLGNDDVMQQAFNVTPKNHEMFLPGVMSRKKQIIPMLTALWG
ncbi:MAG: putative manganese-dependent inorganic diphosphatase [Oscillospiraceae bacterium]|nr:putative manganese-dependent inorganic diphosphatase [Oscillospiraceae bacterium]